MEKNHQIPTENEEKTYKYNLTESKEKSLKISLKKNLSKGRKNSINITGNKEKSP